MTAIPAGGVRIGVTGPAPRLVLDRVLERIDVRGPDECWPALDTVARQNGYPYLTVGSRTDGTRGRVNLMHAVYDLTVGDRPADKPHTDHLCHAWAQPACMAAEECPHRACCNPDHLEAVDVVTNVMRGNGLFALRARATECGRGHEFTPANTLVEKRSNGATYRRCATCRADQTARRRLARTA